MRVIAHTGILTRAALAFIDIDGAVAAVVSYGTVAGIRINPVDATRTVLTDWLPVDMTVVVIVLAVRAFEAAVATLATVVRY